MSQHRRTGGGRGPESLVNLSRRPDVEAAGRLLGHDDARRPGQLPRRDDLLLVSSAERSRPSVWPRRNDPEFVEEP